MSGSTTGGGLLIVNADDWGIDDPTTDAILATFQAGLITSTTGMVYMAGSDRAAGLAGEHGVPVGLHINLTEPFSDPATPPEVRARQQRMIERLGKTSGLAPELPGTSNLMRWIYDPRLQREVDAAIADQVRRFAEIYATPPTHFDGHTHVDLCPNVFLSRAIPRAAKLRNTLDRFPVDGRGVARPTSGGALAPLRLDPVPAPHHPPAARPGRSRPAPGARPPGPGRGHGAPGLRRRARDPDVPRVGRGDRSPAARVLRRLRRRPAQLARILPATARLSRCR
jgi:hypothetical protein